MNYKVDKTDPSYGKVIAITDISKGDLIGDWITYMPVSKCCRFLTQRSMGHNVWWETPDIGRYANHSYTPNTDVVFDSERLTLFANIEIKIGDEIMVNYRETERYIGYITNLDFMNN